MSLAKRLGGIPSALTVAAFVICLFESDTLARGCRRYLLLCGERVVPSLFVFSVLGALIAANGVIGKICRRAPGFGTELGVLLLGLCGGVPLGAITAVELYKNGGLSKGQAEYLCTFSCTPSLSFIIGYTGSVLGSSALGIKLGGLTVLSAVVTMLVFKPLMLKKKERRLTPAVTANKKSFSKTISDSVTGIAVLCGCVIFFGSIAELLPPGLGGLLELTAGIANCKTAASAAFLLGFTGVSIICQVATVCKNELSVLPCVAAKIFQGTFMGIFAYIFID